MPISRQLIIINTTTNPIAVAGVIIPALSSVDFTDFSVEELIVEPNLEPNLMIGDLVINDGTNNLSPLVGMNFLSAFDSNQGSISTTIGGDGNPVNVVVFDDTVLGKTLSIASLNYTWSDEHAKKNDWLRIGDAKHQDAGHVMPFDGTVTVITVWTEKVKKTGSLLLYTGSISNVVATFPVVISNKQFIDTGLNIDFNSGDKLRMRMDSGLETEDIIVSTQVHWR